MGIEGNHRLAVGCTSRQIDLVVLVSTIQRGAAGLETPEDPLLVAQRVSIPRLDEHAYAPAARP